MKVLKKIRNYFCYCGIEKDEYNAIKESAYVSNFKVWRMLHILMSVAFAFLFINSLFNDMLQSNEWFYLIALIYSVSMMLIFFFVLKENSIIAQFLIYLSISMLFLFGCLISQNKPQIPATTFIVFLLITPMFMIDKPYFMVIELIVASVVFVLWMYGAKPYEVWKMDLANIIIYCILGIFIHMIANSIRIKEFVLTRKINILKDIDELTGIKNKGALTREINAFLLDDTKDKGVFIVLDIDKFKSINDTYGHDTGDVVISQIGKYLNDEFSGDEIVGRFGGDEFILFIKNMNDLDFVNKTAKKIINGISNSIFLPYKDQRVSVSLGIAIYNGVEKNYSEIFKKADIALYDAKADRNQKYSIYE